MKRRKTGLKIVTAVILMSALSSCKKNSQKPQSVVYADYASQSLRIEMTGLCLLKPYA